MAFGDGSFASGYGSSSSGNGKRSQKSSFGDGSFASSIATLTEQEQKDMASKKRLDELAALESKKQAQPNFFQNAGKFLGEAANNVGTFLKENTVDRVNSLIDQVDVSVKGGNTSLSGGAGLANPALVKNQIDYINSEAKKGTISSEKAKAEIAKLQGNQQKKAIKQANAEAVVGVATDQNEGVQALADTADLAGIGTALVKGGIKSGIKAGSKATEAATKADEVVQVVNPKTKEKTFYRIPENQRDEIVNGIDNARDGSATAGKSVDGNVTHVTARTPEDMAKRGFVDGGVYGQTDSVGKAVENVATIPGTTPKTPGLGESRYVSKTLPDSDFVGLDTKDLLGSSYQKTTNAQRADIALKALDDEGVDTFSAKVDTLLDAKNLDDQSVFNAQAAAQALEKRGTEGDLQRAANLYNKLSQKLSKAGQVVQAASIMARQTPQGLRYQAQKQFEKAKVEFTPKLQKELNELIKKVEATTPKTEAAARARDDVQYFIAKNIPSSKADQVINFWRAGLLTSPTTTGGAIAGNVAQAIQRDLITDPVSTLADMVVSLFTKQRTTARAKVGASAKGAVEGIKTLGDKNYLKTGFNKNDPAYIAGKYDNPRMTNYGDSALGKGVGTYVNGVYKIMGSADLPFRNAAQSKSLSSMARSEAINRGLKGKEAKKFYDDFIANPPEEFKQRAAQEAEKAVFGNETTLGKAASTLAKNLGPVGQLLIPFAKVPSAVATKVITSTPLGTGHEIVKQIINVRKGGKFDQRALVKAIGEGTTGVPIIGAGWALGANGDITGGYPPTQAERNQWEAEGKKPNSIRIDGKWYSLNYIQPFATLLATGAKAREAADAGLDLNEVIAQASAGTGQSILSQSFLQGLSTAIDAVKNPADFGGTFIANTAGGAIPNIIRTGARAADPLQREASNPLEGLISGIPGARQGLNPKLDDEGLPVENKSTFAETFLNPLKPSNGKGDENTELNQQAIVPAKRLQAVRKKEINQLLANNQVSAAQRKIDEYNQQVSKIIAPYVEKNKDTLTEDQLDLIEKVYLGEVWINKKGRPTISSRSDLPQ